MLAGKNTNISSLSQKTFIEKWTVSLCAGVSAALILLTILLLLFHDTHLSHDEAEHLHVVYAIARGEVPYRDFIENHPVLLHALLAKLQQKLNIEVATILYLIARTSVLIHALGCYLLMNSWLSSLRNKLGLRNSVPLLLLIASGVLAVFEYLPNTELGHDMIWQIRPDWICYFWMLCGCYIWQKALSAGGTAGRNVLLTLAGILIGISTAILPKVVYFLLPIVVTLGLVSFRRNGDDLIATIRECFNFYTKNWVAIIVSAISFALAVAFELNLSGSTPTEYINANFSLNAKKHIAAISVDQNPINVLRGLVGISFPIMVLVFGWWIAYCDIAKNQRNWVMYLVAVLVSSTILVNIALPAFTNGLTWPQYFIPSVLVITVYTALLIDRLFNIAFSNTEGTKLSDSNVLVSPLTKRLLSGAIVLIVVIRILHFGADVYFRAFRIKMDAAGMSVGEMLRKPFLPDEVLPAELTYLTFKPQTKPLAARAWGYFFMLGPDKNLWEDNYAIGIGPNPKTYWKELYLVEPPDIILTTSMADFRRTRAIIEDAQNIKLDWLDAALLEDYTCRLKAGIQVYVRRSLQYRFNDLNWRVCPEKAT